MSSTFKIVEHAAMTGKEPHASEVVEDRIADLSEARDRAKRLAENFPVNGYNEEEDYWWGRNGTPSDGRRFYTVENS